ncbi:hypothetical protein [Cyanothece sp. BG0011]|uniref:hypothetical protein n=1 Tax=Cyanothece sp. BG0011 TaxID=2082950 RepID=UPI000D1E3413|nr:hypothetical protein [Cyanothece sp. BG0011]
MKSRSLYRTAPAMGVAMTVSGLAAAVSYFLVCYARGLLENSLSFGWVLIGTMTSLLPGAIIAMPLGFLVAILWVRGRSARNAVWLGLGYGLVLIVPAGLSGPWTSVGSQAPLGRVLGGYTASFLVQLGAYPLAAWATYKVAPWFNRG